MYHGREQILPVIVKQFCLLPDNLKNELWFYILSSGQPTDHTNIAIEQLKRNGVNCSFHTLDGPFNYYKKIDFIRAQDTEFVLKLDNDIICNSNVFASMLNNAEVTKDPSVMLLSPLLSTGIPSYSLFIHEFFTTLQKHQLAKIMVDVKYQNSWGQDYSSLNEVVSKMGGAWNEQSFYECVFNLRTVYKGVGPQRFSNELCKTINNMILDDFWKIKHCVPKGLVSLKYPYFCTSIFLIERAKFNAAIDNKANQVDPFEEVQINLYRNQNNLDMLFISGAFAIHPTYNSIDGFEELDKKFVPQFVERMMYD